MNVTGLFDLTGKSAAITGGGGVLCGAIAECLASAGAQVAVLDLKVEAAQAVADRINKTGTTVVMATHDQRIVNMMRKRVIQLDRGIIVRDQARGVYE